MDSDLLLDQIVLQCRDDLAALWEKALVTWARSQVSRRIALRCCIAEKRSLQLLLDRWQQRDAP
jgi:hypothetical protein